MESTQHAIQKKIDLSSLATNSSFNSLSRSLTAQALCGGYPNLALE